MIVSSAGLEMLADVEAGVGWGVEAQGVRHARLEGILRKASRQAHKVRWVVTSRAVSDVGAVHTAGGVPHVITTLT